MREEVRRRGGAPQEPWRLFRPAPPKMSSKLNKNYEPKIKSRRESIHKSLFSFTSPQSILCTIASGFNQGSRLTTSSTTSTITTTEKHVSRSGRQEESAVPGRSQPSSGEECQRESEEGRWSLSWSPPPPLSPLLARCRVRINRLTGTDVADAS